MIENEAFSIVPREMVAGKMLKEKEAADFRSKPRRRGDLLTHNIFKAAMAELAESGYAGVSMERVAERAGTGKASLYRRWSSRAELMVDALRHQFPDQAQLPDTGNFRGDCLTMMRMIQGLLSGPVGQAARGLMSEAIRDTELAEAARARIIDSGDEMMLELLRRGHARGEVRSEALNLLVAGVGPAVMRQHFLMHGAPIEDAFMQEVVDRVIIPLVRPGGASA
jgi:AcrR family transcriptional regulator